MPQHSHKPRAVLLPLGSEAPKKKTRMSVSGRVTTTGSAGLPLANGLTAYSTRTFATLAGILSFTNQKIISRSCSFSRSAPTHENGGVN